MTLVERTKLAPDFEICRIINGMWQTAGGHGQIDVDAAILDMMQYHTAEFTTWDMADIYGPAEILFGKFRQKIEKAGIQGLTKFVPSPGMMNKSIVQYNIERSMQRMGVKSIDLVQFHWWDYNDENFVKALENLTKLKQEGKIRYIGLTNFNTETTRKIIDVGFSVISHQVQYSILDQRPERLMIPLCNKHGIKILAYGTLLGGFLSEKYLNAPEPVRADLNTLSLQKYKNMIDAWGGWERFQELLSCLKKIAMKHNSSISNIALKFILDKPAVSGTIVGTRLGISEHRVENAKVFGLNLDKEDLDQINGITTKSNDLIEVIGDCGDEYR